MDVQMEMILKGGQFKKLLEEQSLELRQKYDMKKAHENEEIPNEYYNAFRGKLMRYIPLSTSSRIIIYNIPYLNKIMNINFNLY